MENYDPALFILDERSSTQQASVAERLKAAVLKTVWVMSPRVFKSLHWRHQLLNELAHVYWPPF